MKSIKLASGLLFIVLLQSRTYGQGEIPVRMYTGTPGIYIPMYTLQDHDLAENISLVYSVGDLRVDGEHRYGVGWDISVGAQVSRKVHGLPDDFKGGSGDSRRGWLYNSNYSSILTFPNKADTILSDCTDDEESDQAFISGLNYLKDTEPDVFSFSVGGQSGSFVFGNDKTIRLIPYQDIRIKPTYRDSAGGDFTIIKWAITTSDGVEYTLDQRCSASYHLSKSTIDSDSVNQTMVSAFERDFQYYKTNTFYYSAWMLSKASSPSGASLTYTYTIASTTSHSVPKRAMIFDAQWQPLHSDIVRLTDFDLMSESLTDSTRYVSTITASTGVWVSIDPVNGVKIYDPLRSSTDSFKEFRFTYEGSFLTKVTESDHFQCTQMPPYQMYYNNKSDYPLPGGNLQAKDFWGYYNGAIDNGESVPGGGSRPTYIPTIYVYPDEAAIERYRIYPIPNYTGTFFVLNGNATRWPEANYVTHGALSRLIYPTGGETDISFECNKYWDAKAGRDQLGGGLRVKQIVYYNGIDPAPNVIKNFFYTDASGHSSGRLISRPSFAIPVWKYSVPTFGKNTGYSKTYAQLTTPQSQWKALTMLTGWDVSDQEYTGGSPIGYLRVAVARPGSGKAVFDYSVPATYDQRKVGSGSTKWDPTITKLARPSCDGLDMIIPAGEALEYSLFPNTKYDYERGLPLTKSEYNEAGTLVRYTQNTYQYIFKGTQPDTVIGLAYDLFANSSDIFLYGRYKYLTNIAKVTSSETVTTYDDTTPAKHAAEVTQYTYGSTYHRYPTKITRTTPEGTVYGTSMKYTLDYPATLDSVADIQLDMILELKKKFRNAVPIEQQSTVKLFNGTEKTVGASMLRFAPVSTYKPLLQYTSTFRPLAPVTDFVPSGVTSNVFTNDSRYETVMTVNEYTTKYDMPLSSSGEGRVTSATLYGYNNRFAVAQVAMAKTTEVAFSDFEAKNTASFDTLHIYTGKGRTGATGVYPYATLSRTIAKPSVATKYLLTFWLKNTPSTSVGLTITMKNSGGTTLSTTNYSYTPTTSAYQYFVQPIDVSALPSMFKIEIKGQSFSAPSGGSSPSLLPMLDDVAFYPDYASISSVTYDIPFGPNSTTAGNGMTSFSSYDGLGRIKIIRDQDNNIRKRYTYNMPGQTSPLLVAAIASHTGNYYVDGNDIFIAQDNPCVAGELYEWKYSTSATFSTPSTSTTSPTFTYLTAGNDSVTLRVTHPDYVQPVLYKFKVTIVRPPLTQTTCAGGTQQMNNSNVTTARYDCITPSISDGFIKVTVSIGNIYGSTLSYQWKKRDVGATTWNNAASTTNTYPQSTVNSAMNSFQLMCEISANDGRTINSDVITVTINH